MTGVQTCALPICLVHHQGVGYHDTVDIAALRERQIALAIAPGGTSVGVAEHTLMMMLAVGKRLAYVDAELRQGRWHANDLRAESHQLGGSTVGIVGLGRIGSAVARRALAFGMDVVWHDPHVDASAPLPGRRLADLGELLETSDIVSLHCPLTDETRGLLGRAALARIKPGAILVNTSRGAVADLDAVHEALRSGRLGGAAIDVFPQEPPDPSSPLVEAFRMQPSWAAGRIVLSPHAAFFSPQSWREMREKAAATARDLLTKGWLRNCVNQAHLAAGSGLRPPAKPD